MSGTIRPCGGIVQRQMSRRHYCPPSPPLRAMTLVRQQQQDQAGRAVERRHPLCRLQACRGKRTGAWTRRGSNYKRAESGSGSRGGTGAARGGGGGGGGGKGEYVFGLRPVNYGRAAPPEICMSPPPPPPKAGLTKYIFPGSVFVTLGLTAYFYVNNQNDSYEYWDAMQKGGTILEDDDDDDDDDDLEDDGFEDVKDK